MQCELGAIIVGALGRHYGWIHLLALGDAADGVAHESSPGGELRPLLDMLQLAATAIVLDIVGATRLHPVG